MAKRINCDRCSWDETDTYRELAVVTLSVVEILTSATTVDEGSTVLEQTNLCKVCWCHIKHELA